MLMFGPKSFAQETSPEYVVQVTYFYPSDHEPSDAVEAKFEKIAIDAQKIFAGEMERHGFGGKTFTLETDENGNNVIHRIKGKFPSSHYSPRGFFDFIRHFDISSEVRERLDTPKQFISLVFINEIDKSKYFPLSKGTHSAGTLITRLLNFEKAGKESYNVALSTTLHELGHAFGLPHDERDNRYIMHSGANPSIARLSNCAAKWLDVSRYFNTTQNAFDQVPSIEMLEPTLVSPPNSVRLRFEITHSKRLHQALLIMYSGILPYHLVSYSRNLFGTHQCKSLSGNSETIDFVTDDLQPDSRLVILAVIDVHGNYIEKRFPIDMSSVLSGTTPVPISIPDVNLETAIRNELELAPESPITKLDMLSLLRIKGNFKQITDLTGIEYATHLKVLFLNNNQIVDFTPLTALKELNSLYLSNNQITDVRPFAELKQLRLLDLSGNQIHDIKPLAGLTNLGELYLASNPISDISPLAGLTQLYDLWLFNNNISDITPLANLTDLHRLYLSGNQITDVRPLAELTQLYDLRLFNNNISDITPLANLTDLQKLNLGDNQITDVEPLTKLTQLYDLRLDKNSISDITPLANLTDLQKLNLNVNQIADVDPLAKLTNLNILLLTFNPISDVTPLVELNHLRELYLIRTQITNRKPLFTLLRKNPDVKIFLDFGQETLLLPTSQLPEDVKADGVINILDLTCVASHFGELGDNIGDVNGDEIVDILDLVQVASAFGDTTSTP